MLQSRLFMNTFKRHLHLQEWQGKQLLASHNINVQRFKTISSGTDIATMLGDITWQTVVVKAQCEAGGRGKGRFMGSGLRGVEVLHGFPKQGTITDTVMGMLEDRLVTAQTGPDGIKIDRVMVVEGKAELGAERYMAMVLDRHHKRPMVMVSRHGGMAVEEHGDVQMCAVDDTARIAGVLGIEDTVAGRLVMRLHDLFVQNDAVLVEINPLCITSGEEPLAVDAKITIDDNALFRHPQRYDTPSEQNYVRLEDDAVGVRSVGCMVNGAGLAMATMDMLGPKACNFMDVGGTATVASIKSAFTTLLSDPRVKTIFVNVFGGIVRCDVIADGIKQALADPAVAEIVEERVHKIVVRLAGTNAEAGLKSLQNVAKVVPCGDLQSAASLAIDSESNCEMEEC